HQRSAVGLLPQEVPADRTAQLKLVAGLEPLGQVGRYLAVLKSFNGDHEMIVVGTRRDRIAPLRLVAVLSGQPHVDMLTGPVPVPVGHVEHDARRPARLGYELDDLAELPVQSPW